MSTLELLSYSFMQRALIAGIFLSVLLGVLGVFATARRMAFFGDGMAHSALLGIAIATILGLAPLPLALIIAVLAALIIAHLERSTKLPSDTLIGIIFTAAMAGGIVLMSLQRGYQPELVSYLFGSILSLTNNDVWLIGGFTIAILAWIQYIRKPLTLMSLSEESAIVFGVPVNLYTTLFYCALAVAVILASKMLGVILVSALLIIPAATSRLLTKSLKSHITVSTTLSVITVVLGLFLSAIIGAPSGATIVLLGTALFLFAYAYHQIKRHNRTV